MQVVFFFYTLSKKESKHYVKFRFFIEDFVEMSIRLYIKLPEIWIAYQPDRWSQSKTLRKQCTHAFICPKVQRGL